MMLKPSVSQYLVAHRGNSAHAPENTLSAIQSALDNDILHIEIDLQLTSDDVIIVMHDDSVDRTTDGNGTINNMSCAEIAMLDAGINFSKEFAGEKVPKLTDVLHTVNNTDCTLFLEVKNPSRYPGFADRLNETIKEYEGSNKIVVISFDQEWLNEFKQINPKTQVGKICLWTGRTSAIKEMTTIHVHWLSVILDPTLVYRVHKNGQQLIAWTVNNNLIIRVLLKLGVDGITTDNPITATTVL